MIYRPTVLSGKDFIHKDNFTKRSKRLFSILIRVSNKEWDLFIEGDNLEVIKTIAKSQTGCCIAWKDCILPAQEKLYLSWLFISASTILL